MVKSTKDVDLRICGTSELLRGNVAWKNLTTLYDVSFGRYGDWPSALIESDGKLLLWVAFIQDLVSIENCGSTKIDATLKNIEGLLLPLTRRLDSSNKPCIVLYSSYVRQSSICSARELSDWDRVSLEFQAQLFKLRERHLNLYLIDLDKSFSYLGMEKCFDFRNFYSSRCRLSSRGLQILSAEIIDVIERVERSAKKVLVLDCDNTLWGGVIGEAGLDGIALGSDGVGQIFTNFQSVIKYLASSGVLLAIASKNDEGDVMTVFDRHPGMRINKDEIVSWKVNWKEKSSNLAEIASDLDLGLDSFVFWDDNPLEREKMRNALPMVLTPEVPSDVHEWPSHLYALTSFSKFTSTTEDSKKIEQYKQRSIFITEKERSANELDFLKSIQMKPRSMRIGPETLSRAEQLSNKTNQFNLRVNRYNLVDLQKISSNSDKYVAFMVSLEDRYGNHGIVGMVIAEINGCTAFLDTFLFSCRILGRHVESWALESLINVLRDKNISLLYAEYKQKDRNSMVANFLSENGMKEMGRDESQVPYAAVHEVDAGIFYTKKLDGWIFPKTEVFIDAIE